jgi:segregation and condensation protein A
MTDTTISPRVLVNDYQLRLPSFEGPLDVLLRLIERSELPISEVSLVAVTDQFLEYVNQIGGIEPESLAEFTAIGARLVLLKSRSLLPRPVVEGEEEVEDDLVSRLRDYQAAKNAAGKLAELQQRGERGFGRIAAVSLPRSTEPVRLAPHQALSLARALRRRLSTIPSPVQLIQGRERIPIRVMLERALSLVLPGRRSRFTDVAGSGATREETMTAFLAVLILVRRRVFDAEQQQTFGEIDLWRTAEHVPHLTELIPADAMEAS